MKHTEEEKLAAFGQVLDVMDKLRAGCPWNAAQTWDTLRPMTVEEVYELSDAVMKKSGKRRNSATFCFILFSMPRWLKSRANSIS